MTVIEFLNALVLCPVVCAAIVAYIFGTMWLTDKIDELTGGKLFDNSIDTPWRWQLAGYLLLLLFYFVIPFTVLELITGG